MTLTCDQASLIFFVAAGRYLPAATKNIRDAWSQVRMTLTCAITEVSPDQVVLECWRASFSTVCNPHRVPMMNRWLVKKFKNGLFYTCIFFIHFISNHQQKYRKGHVFSNPRTFLIKHLICYNFLRISRIPETTSQYPVSL